MFYKHLLFYMLWSGWRVTLWNSSLVVYSHYHTLFVPHHILLCLESTGLQISTSLGPALEDQNASSVTVFTTKLNIKRQILLVQVWLRQRYYAPQVLLDWGSNPWSLVEGQYISCCWGAHLCHHSHHRPILTFWSGVMMLACHDHHFRSYLVPSLFGV